VRLAQLFALAVAPALAAARQELAAGEHAVGFRSAWELDWGRCYRTRFDAGETYGRERAPRPVLVELWYPALPEQGARAMAHGDYFDIVPEDAALAPLAGALRAFALDVLAQETVGRAVGELEADQRAAWEALLATPTGVVRDAPFAEGPFPLVIYHPGAGSSFEDNARLCEHLASHGYVVASSAYLEGEGRSLAVDGGTDSAEDMQLLVARSRALPCVDWSRVGVVGHSLGAQAALRWATRPGCPADALVLLDTTQDYYSLALPLHRDLVEEVAKAKERVDQSLLVVAGPEAVFLLVDELVAAERTLLLVPDLSHNEFIAQGIQRLALLARPGLGAEAQELERAPAVRARYAEVCESVLAFLDAKLRGSSAAFEARAAAYEREPLGARSVRLERAPRGASGPPPFDPASAPETSPPPTPRQLFALLATAGPEVAADVLERWHDVAPESPIYTSTMFAASLLQELARGDDVERARAFYRRFLALQPQALGLFESFGGLFESTRPRLALELLRSAAFYRPEDAELAERIGALEKVVRD